MCQYRMDSATQAWATLREYTLKDIEYTETVIRRQGSVLELYYHGLRCAGKQISPETFGQGDDDMIRRFAEESRLLSQIRHPNIVQFLGVHFQKGARIPVLVLEFLPISLAQRIDKNAELGSLPDEIIYSILSDVALGLNYLHGHSLTSPIVHRDLSANNILLTKDLTAKISDLGVAKILNINPLKMTKLTKVPGTPCYMPPEALEDNPEYNTSIDIFSYGVLMIHIFSGKWPSPTKAVIDDPDDSTKLIALSEAKRRQKYLDDITPDHPLMDLILSCISNNPTCRPTASKVLQDVRDAEARFSPTSKEELLQRVKALSVCLVEVEERAKSEEQHTQSEEKEVALKEVTSKLRCTPAPDSEYQGHERVVVRPQISRSSQKRKKKNQLHDVFASMEALRARLEARMKTAQKNIDQIKAAHLSQNEFYTELENSKEQCQELVATIEERRQTVESLIAELNHAEEKGEMQALKLQEGLEIAQELCSDLQHFLQVRDTTTQKFQETQKRLGELMHEAFL